MKKISPVYVIVLLLLAPYFLLLTKLNTSVAFDVEELWWVFKNSAIQSLGSSFATIFFAVILAGGILSLPGVSKSKAWLLRMLLWPTFLPHLLVIILLLNVVDPFPIGTIGIILVQTMIYSGLIAVELTKNIQSQSQSMVETALVYGSRPWKNFFLLLSKHRRDLRSFFLLVFTMAFTSFSVPLIIGGGRGTNIEILIYEKIRISGNWSAAISYSLLQMVFLLALSFLHRPQEQKNSSALSSSPWPSGASPYGLQFFSWFYVLFFVFGFLYEALQGFIQLRQLPFWKTEMFARLIPSITLSVMVGFLTMSMLSLSVWGWPLKRPRQFLLGYVSPSTALIGFAFLFVSGFSSSHSSSRETLVYCFAFSLLMLPGLYRLLIDQKMETLRDQISTAQILGATPMTIWLRIILPQIGPSIGRASGLSALWAIGDFALAKLLLRSDNTLALMSEGLVSSYRIEASAAIAFLIVVIGFGIYLFFEGIAHVYHRKFV